MKTAGRWMEGAKSEAAATVCSSNTVSLVWIVVLAAFFYLAFVLAGLAGESAALPTSARTISIASTSSSSQPRESWFHRTFHKPTWSELLEECKSPRDICHVVERFVGYRTEEVDRWNPAAETWKNSRGDCEDFAILIETLCHTLGFSATVNLYFPSGLRGEGHAVAVGMWNGKMWMSSNGSYEEVDSIDEVRKTVAQMYGCSKDMMWGTVLAHADIERRLRSSSGPSVAAAVGR